MRINPFVDLSFDKTKYNQRNITETKFSVVKRKFGETIRARKFQKQVKEIKIKFIVYNIVKKNYRDNLHKN